MGQVFLRVLRFFPFQYLSTIALSSYSSSYYSYQKDKRAKHGKHQTRQCSFGYPLDKLLFDVTRNSLTALIFTTAPHWKVVADRSFKSKQVGFGTFNSENGFARRMRLKCDGTRAETRFRFSAKRLSPFKSAGASVQSTTGSRGVRISGSNAGYTMF